MYKFIQQDNCKTKIKMHQMNINYAYNALYDLVFQLNSTYKDEYDDVV